MIKMGDTKNMGLIVYTGTRDELQQKLRERDDRITLLEDPDTLWNALREVACVIRPTTDAKTIVTLRREHIVAALKLLKERKQ